MRLRKVELMLLPNSGDITRRTYTLNVRLDWVGKTRIQPSLSPHPSQDITTRFLIVPSNLADSFIDPQHAEGTDTTDAPAVLDSARRWFTKCLSDHEPCKEVDSRDSDADSRAKDRPTRLIDLEQDSIRLHTTDQAADTAPYATLSHRWPAQSSSLLQLSTANIAQFHISISEADPAFSQVFRDAVKVCRHLAIRYLWIDSLCIIQSGDDGHDWRHEASRMGSVYRNGVLNIAASSVSDGHEGIRTGFFRSRSAGSLSPAILSTTYDYGQRKKQHAEYHMISTHDRNDELDAATLNTRAWVMQERHLSPRILHFAENQVWWECNNSVYSEMYPLGDPVFTFRPPRRSKDFLAQLVGIPRDIHAESLQALWHELVRVYSGGALTVAQDKLIAFSGIAKEVQIHTISSSDQYLAGIWHQHLPYALLWKTRLDKDEKTIDRPKADEIQQAPSWSWASVHCETSISYNLHRKPHDVLARIEEVHIRPTPDDPFGAVQPGGYLKLRGTLYKAQLSYSGHTKRACPELQADRWSSRLGKKISMKWRGSFTIAPDEVYVYGRMAPARVVYLLPVLKSKAKLTSLFADAYDATEWAVVLLLEPAEKEGEFRRCGLLELTGVNSHSVVDRTRAARTLQSEPESQLITIL